MYFFKRFRSLNSVNIGSVGKRASKLLAVKFRVLKKKSATSAILVKLCDSAFGPGSSLPKLQSFLKFDAWQL